MNTNKIEGKQLIELPADFKPLPLDTVLANVQNNFCTSHTLQTVGFYGLLVKSQEAEIELLQSTCVMLAAMLIHSQSGEPVIKQDGSINPLVIELDLKGEYQRFMALLKDKQADLFIQGSNEHGMTVLNFAHVPTEEARAKIMT